MTSVELNQLRRTESRLIDLAWNLELEIRRDRDRKRKRSIAILDRIGPKAWQVAAVLLSLSTTSRTMSRMYVYWHLKRALARGPAGSVGQTSQDEIDARIDDVTSGPLGAAVVAVVADIENPMHFSAMRWLAEHQTYLWLIESNIVGASPPSTDLFERFQRFFPASSKGQRYNRFVDRVMKATRSVNKWGMTYRKRWQVLFKELPKATPLSDEQLSQRVTG